MHIIYLINISYMKNATFEENEVKELTSRMNVNANYLLGQCIIKIYPYNLGCDHERTKLKNDFFIIPLLVYHGKNHKLVGAIILIN